MIKDFTPIRWQGLADVLREHRRSRPGIVALVDGGLRLTYAALDQRVNRLATALAARDVGAGDRLLWLGQNSVRLIEILLACAKLGAIVCPANWRMSAEEVRWTIDDFDPKVVFWQSTEIGANFETPLHGWHGDRLWVQHDGADEFSYDGLLAVGRDEDQEIPVDPAMALLAIYTGAFSGRPNAALLSHTALIHQGLLCAKGQVIDEASVFMLSGPMFHIGPLIPAMAVFLFGGRSVVVARTEAREVLQLIAAERPTHGYVPKPLMESMRALNEDGRYDVSSLFAKPDFSDWDFTLVMPASAPQRVKRAGYGQTELTGLSILTWLGGDGAGRPAPMIQVKLLDDDGNEVETGAVGEIAVRGALVMSGYFRRDAENVGRMGHGWYRTHDLGRRNADGSISFVAPKSVMIKSGKENIYPAEVEACLLRHPAVRAACVIGCPDPKWDQNVKAVVVLDDSMAASADELIEHCRRHMASYKKPKLVEFVAALPRHADGSVDRKAVDVTHGGGGYPSSGIK